MIVLGAGNDPEVRLAIDNALFYARRLGLGLRPNETLQGSPRDWAMDQLRAAPDLDFYGPDGKSILSQLPPTAKPLEDFEAACKTWEAYRTTFDKLNATSASISNDAYQQKNWADVVYPYMRVPIWRDILVKTMTAVNGPSPVFERFWMFWCNHFVIAVDMAEIKLFWGPHGRNIRRRMLGSFADLLFDSIANPGMLLYLNNDTSSGPHSRAAAQERQNRDLNENLGRELLELHTLSPAAGYTQNDVIQTALLLTGWQMYAGAVTNGGHAQNIPYGTRFNPYRHEPGPRTIMGKVYRPKGSGGNMLHDLCVDLAASPATAKFLSMKLARAFIADDPPQDSVDRIAKAFIASKADMLTIHSAVVDEIIALAPQHRKLSMPEQWLVESYRTTGATIPLATPQGNLESIAFVYKEIGQALEECPQPNGYSTLSADWLSKAMLDRRVRQAYRIGIQAASLTVEALGDYAERLAGADSPLVALVKRAESRPIAVACLLASPQFLKT